MKHFLFLALFVSTSAMAIDFNKVTGTFSDVETDAKKEVTVSENTDLAYGSFTPKDQDAGTRAPASVEESAEKDTSFNAVTGTFEYQND